MTKTTVAYTKTSPLEERGMNYVAIENEEGFHRVFATYRTNGNRWKGVPLCVMKQPNIHVVSIKKARVLYDFEKIKDSLLGGL